MAERREAKSAKRRFSSKYLDFWLNSFRLANFCDIREDQIIGHFLHGGLCYLGDLFPNLYQPSEPRRARQSYSRRSNWHSCSEHDSSSRDRKAWEFAWSPRCKRVHRRPWLSVSNLLFQHFSVLAVGVFRMERVEEPRRILPAWDARERAGKRPVSWPTLDNQNSSNPSCDFSNLN